MQEALVKNLEMLLGDAIEEINTKGITITLGGNF